MVVLTDNEWASCKSTRRSNSGGWVFRCRHLLHHLCRVQTPVALSTGDAELYAQIRGLQEMVSLKCLMEEFRPGPHAGVYCTSGFNCMQRYHAPSRSWPTQSFGNANSVDPTNSSTGSHRGSTDLTYREIYKLSRVSQLVSRSLSSSHSNGWHVAWSAVGRICRSSVQLRKNDVRMS